MQKANDNSFIKPLVILVIVFVLMILTKYFSRGEGFEELSVQVKQNSGSEAVYVISENDEIPDIHGK